MTNPDRPDQSYVLVPQFSAIVVRAKKYTVKEYEEACNNVTPWYVLSFLIAACTVPYR